MYGFLLLDYSKSHDLTNHDKLVKKLSDMTLPPHLVRWMAAFLHQRVQSVKVGSGLSEPS